MKNLFPLTLLLLALACSQPRSTESFIRGTGPYEFTVDMTDSTVAYSFDLFSRIDAMDFPTQLQLDITWKDPQYSSFTETVYLPVERGSSFFSQESFAPYRADVVPAVPGLWTVTVAVPNPPEGLCGLGLVVHRSPLIVQMVDNQ